MEPLRDDATLVVSELVTNAMQHAPGVDSYELEITRRSAGVRVSIADGSSVRPLVKQLSHDAPRGRGMAIVAALSSRWGADDHHGGKRVWVDLDAAESW
jgi:two-component sensor histidine kinase